LAANSYLTSVSDKYLLVAFLDQARLVSATALMYAGNIATQSWLYAAQEVGPAPFMAHLTYHFAPSCCLSFSTSFITVTLWCIHCCHMIQPNKAVLHTTLQQLM